MLGVCPDTARPRTGAQLSLPSMTTDAILERAARDAAQLRALHHGDQILVLPNAWDPISAAIVAAAGARAVATTSSGVSWAMGRRDGHGLSRDEAVAAIARIVDSVKVPVSADIEGGYGLEPAAVAATVRGVVGAGASGINLEDSPGPAGGLIDPSLQADRLRAARSAARELGVELVINARTDVYLRHAAAPGEELRETVERGRRYADAGADCLFVPGLLDLDTLAELVAALPLPVSVMAGPGGPGVGELAAAGVRRVSLGGAIAEAAYAVVRRAAVEVLERGTFTSLAEHLEYAELNRLLG